MKKKLKWRLGKLPSPDEVSMLVKDKIITNEEAKEILFSEAEEGERDNKDLESEIRFLRELVSKLSDKSSIVTTIREIQYPYNTYVWYKPYHTWCSYNTANGLVTDVGNVTTSMYLSNSGTTSTASSLIENYGQNGTSSSFSDIKTF